MIAEFYLLSVEEFFIKFVKVIETTGNALFIQLKSSLKNLKLDLIDMPGQGYDNGLNMKGQYKSVSSRVLKEYPRTFYSSCGCHYLNLALCDMTMSSIQGKSFFGMVQRI